jgi:O-antigen ligase
VPKFSRIVIGAAVVVAVIAYPLLQEAAAEGDGDASQRLFQDAENDQSAAGHVALFQVGVAIAMDYPFTGVGHEHFEDIAMDYINVVDLGGAETEAQGEATIGKQRPHNDWLSVWVSWGFGALLAYACVFVGTFINCLHTLRHSSPLCRVLAVGCIAGLAQYAVNSFLHNYLDSSLLLFVYAGVSVALVRIASDQDERRKRLGPNRRTHRPHADSRARRAAFA